MYVNGTVYRVKKSDLKFKSMENSNKLTNLGKSLRDTRVGGSVKGLMVRRYSPSTRKGTEILRKCGDCAFRSAECADGCDMRWACMAHFRPDRESVIFAKV